MCALRNNVGSMANQSVNSKSTEKLVPAYRFNFDAHKGGNSFGTFWAAGFCVALYGAATHSVDFVALVDDIV